MLKSDKRDIDGYKVETQQLPPRRAFKLAAKLAKYLAPAFRHLGDVKMEDDIETLLPAVTSMLMDLDERDLDAVLCEAFANTTVVVPDATGGKVMSLETPEKIDAAFEGAMYIMLRAAVFSLEVNFRDFFDAAKREIAKKKLAAEAKAKAAEAAKAKA
jgi:hypothetical protein